MKLFHIRQQHTAYYRLNIMDISITIISERIRCQTCDNRLGPILVPCINRHIRGCKDSSMQILILCICKPIPSLWKRFKIMIAALTVSVYEPCAVPTILSLTNAISAFFTFQIFPHLLDSFPYMRKRANPTIWFYHKWAFFSREYKLYGSMVLFKESIFCW